jgi:hypothetical protein
MSGWWMTIAPESQERKLAGDLKSFRVDYNIPNSGTFTTWTNEETARMLQRAKAAGACEARARIRKELDL